MALEIQNADSSFFVIKCEQLKSADKDLTRYLQENVISLTINEEYNLPVNGTLTMHDPNLVWSRILRNGMELDLTWGYKKWNKDPLELGITTQNHKELVGGAERRGLKCLIMTPSGNASSNGNITFNATFYASEMFTQFKPRIWTGGTKGEMIRALLKDIGCERAMVKFKRENEKIGQMIQDSGSYKFLQRMSWEWKTAFQVGYNKNGKRIGLFIDPSVIDRDIYIQGVTGARGSWRTLDYKGGMANVIEYSWRQHVGENGTGDNIRIIPVSGDNGTTFVFQRLVAKTETVETWVLNTELMKKEMGEKANIAEKYDLLVEWLSNNNWDEIKKYFTSVPATTAPQGFGYTINLKMLGDPLITTPLQVRFGVGFPDRLGQGFPSKPTQGKMPASTDAVNKALTTFFVKKITHTIAQTGYLCDLEIVDALTQFGGAVY